MRMSICDLNIENAVGVAFQVGVVRNHDACRSAGVVDTEDQIHDFDRVPEVCDIGIAFENKVGKNEK